VTNFGTVIGDVIMGIGTGTREARFYNGKAGNPSGRLVLPDGGRVDLGRNGLFENNGILDIAGVGTIGTATMASTFIQSRSGTWIVDVAATADGTRRSDVLRVPGANVVLDGTIQPNVIGGLLPGPYRIVVSDTHQDIVPAGAVIRESTLQSNAVPISWRFSSQQGLAIEPIANFTNPTGVVLTQDQRAVAQSIQQAWDTRSIGSSALFGQFARVTSKSDYASDLSELNPDQTQNAVAATAIRARSGLKAVLSCPGFPNGTAFLREGDCVWGRVTGNLTRQGGNADDTGYRQTTQDYRVGAQAEFARDWFLGLAAGYAGIRRTDPDQITNTRQEQVEVAAALKHQVGPWLFAASTELGYGWLKNLRSIDFQSNHWTAQSDANVFSAAARFRGQYQVVFDDWYLKPYLDLDVLYNHVPGFRETGISPFNLTVRKLDTTLFAANPALEVGARFDWGGLTIRPYGTVGATVLSDKQIVGKVRFQEGEDATYRTTTRIPNALADLTIGLQVITVDQIEISAEFVSQFGRSYTSRTASGRLAYRF
jgi:outer membrane autotransporter protein